MTTASSSETLPRDPMVPPEPVPLMQHRKFTADEFEKLGEVGILTDEERVELIEGDIIVMGRIKSPHAACVNRLTRMLVTGTGERAVVTVQNPVRLSTYTEPAPDLSLAHPCEDFYRQAHPRPNEMYLAIEVMETTQFYDYKVKLPLYGRNGVPELWLIDLPGQVLEVYRRPFGDQYIESQQLRPGQQIAPEASPELVLAVDAILNRPES
jgi:Uma2 family endonuclease